MMGEGAVFIVPNLAANATVTAKPNQSRLSAGLFFFAVARRRYPTPQETESNISSFGGEGSELSFST